MIPNFIKIDSQTYFADIQIGMNKVLIDDSTNQITFLRMGLKSSMFRVACIVFAFVS